MRTKFQVFLSRMTDEGLRDFLDSTKADLEKVDDRESVHKILDRVDAILDEIKLRKYLNDGEEQWNPLR